METAATESTKVIKFSELLRINVEDGTRHRYHYQIPVKRSDHPRCIYKAFKDIDGMGLYVRLHKSGNNSSIGSMIIGIFAGTDSQNNTVDVNIYELEPAHENWRMKFDLPEVEIIMDEKIQVLPIQDKSQHYHRNNDLILIKGEKHSVKVNLPQRGSVGNLQEKDGKFFRDHFGVWFDAVPYYYNSNTNYDPETILQSFNNFSANFTDRDQKNRFLLMMAKEKQTKFELHKSKIEGISKSLANVQPFFDELAKDPKDILSLFAFMLAAEASKRTINNVKFSVIFNKIFSDIKTQDEFNAKIREMADILEKVDVSYSSADRRDYHTLLMDSIPEARDIKKAALKRKSTGAINKIMDDLDFISIDKDKYPLTHEAIFSGEIPKGTFFRKNGDSYFVYNDNWEVWEEILAVHKDVAIAIATEASRRTTFEKDLMSYFFFVLHKLPEYLEKQTGRKWKCIPKLVSAEKELEPPTEGSNGVSKQRSALTPIVDNEKNEVVVPYVSMRLSGYQTSYCYGLDYNVLERGMSFKGNSVTRDVEKNLNGRDDYGLMFYTLTGSAQAQGYPTFLIIFEHLDTTTKVHFHRTHPMRSKGGDYNPIHGWTIGCYKWMVGNVNFERIKAQQGDLVFVEMLDGTSPFVDDTKVEDKGMEEVNAYDNHKFATPVKFLPYAKKEKSNILGYFKIEKDTMLNHHEHKPRMIPAGIYELRQCRSWEANPKGVWSLRID
jgi:hypothetical protein